MTAKAICVKCETELRPFKNGVTLAEMFQDNAKIYRLIRGDVHYCPICGYKIVTGLAQDGIEHYEDDLEKRVELLKERGETIIYSKVLKSEDLTRASLLECFNLPNIRVVK